MSHHVNALLHMSHQGRCRGMMSKQVSARCCPCTLSTSASAGMSLAKMVGVVAVGMPLTLLSTAQVAFLIRRWVQTDMLEMPAADQLPPFHKQHFISWGSHPDCSSCCAFDGPSCVHMHQQKCWGCLPQTIHHCLHPTRLLALLHVTLHCW